jgi:hypothetical protein
MRCNLQPFRLHATLPCGFNLLAFRLHVKAFHVIQTFPCDSGCIQPYHVIQAERNLTTWFRRNATLPRGSGGTQPYHVVQAEHNLPTWFRAPRQAVFSRDENPMQQANMMYHVITMAYDSGAQACTKLQQGYNMNSTLAHANTHEKKSSAWWPIKCRSRPHPQFQSVVH